MNDTNSVWKAVLGGIQTEIPSASFVTLFKNTSLVSTDGQMAIISVPSIMAIDLIQKRFLQQVKSGLEKQLGYPIDIQFIAKSPSRENPQESGGPLFAQDIIALIPPKTTLSRVRPDYLFETLAVSSSNQLAFISATTVAKNLGISYNPLFIYGPTGVGKTHLMQAIANDVHKRDHLIKVIYLTSEEFTNEVVEAIRTNQTHIMKKRFRTCSLLIIDDVQFIAGKDKVQEELFHTFNILIDNSSQIVLSSDRPPHEIKKLEGRLSSRFAGGLTVDIEPPDFELKTAILLIKSKKTGVNLPIEVAKIIAENVEDARSLEGILLRMLTESSSLHVPLSEDLALKVLGQKKREQNTHLHPDDIVNVVCDYYSIKQTQIKGARRNASLVRARQISMYLLKKELGLTLIEIGNILGGRDHTTIMHGVKKVEKQIEMRQNIYEDIVGITQKLR